MFSLVLTTLPSAYYAVITFIPCAFCCSWRYIAVFCSPCSLCKRNTKIFLYSVLLTTPYYICNCYISLRCELLVHACFVPTSQLLNSKHSTNLKRKPSSYMDKQNTWVTWSESTSVKQEAKQHMRSRPPVPSIYTRRQLVKAYRAQNALIQCHNW
jgi:hypothetical protein